MERDPEPRGHRVEYRDTEGTWYKKRPLSPSYSRVVVGDIVSFRKSPKLQYEVIAVVGTGTESKCTLKSIDNVFQIDDVLADELQIEKYYMKAVGEHVDA